jgi:type IV secretion system protein VirB9
MRPAALLLALGLTLGAALPAAALEVPRGGSADARIKSVAYDPAQVVRIVGVPGTATQILFSPEETVEHVALGDSGAWDVAAERNILFIKPKRKGAATNLIVTTSRAEGARSYVFELRPGGGRRLRDSYFVLRFRYPGDQRAQARAVTAAAAAALSSRILQLKLDRGAVEGPRNLAYSVQGPAALQPSEVSDNGRFTVLRFARNQPLPAIYTVSADGSEALAAFDVRGEFVVVHGVAPALRLRQGRSVLCITNDAYHLHDGAGTLTASGEVTRTDLGTSR